MIRKALLLPLVLVAALCGQILSPPGPGSLKGTITDDSGALVPGATVTATDSAGHEKTTTSAADGTYALSRLAAGVWSVEVTSPGFHQTKPALVTIGTGLATLDIPLAVAAHKQEITVQETVGPVVTTDPSQNASALVMHGDDLEALADDPDDLQADLEALAGPAAGPNGGQIYIDGFSGGDAPLPSKDAIREIRVNQNPFSPEYDSIGFGRIEILTKPGADRFRGGTYFNYGNDALNSRNPYAPEKAPFSLKEYGGNVGGPMSKNSSFFADVDKRDIDNGGIINAITLDPATLAVVNPYSQTFSNPLRRLRFSSRADYQLNQSNTLIFRYTLNRDEIGNAGVGNFNLATQGYKSLAKEHAFEATETAVLSATVVNETHFQFRHQNSTQGAADTDPAIIVSNSFNGGGASSGIHDYIHHHYEVQNYTTIASGRHAVKFGIRLRAVDIQDTSRQNFNGAYTFGGAYAPVLDAANMPVSPGIVCQANAPSAGCATISSIEQYRRTLLFRKMGLPAAQVRLLGGGATQFSINAGDPFIHAGGYDAGLFVGDDWRIRPNLTLSLGLRYETQDNIGDHADWAPRLGFAWAPGGSSTTSGPKFVIRGGFGIFYDRFSEQNVLLAQRFNGKSQQQYVVLSPDT
ncbi:MAG: carboxypeptidase regulatory-like domain-containing protein, partial [Acidobacteriota bacterium]